MKRLLVKNIGRIVGIQPAGRLRVCGAEMDRLETLDDAWLLTDGQRIAAFGRMESLDGVTADEVADAEGGMLFPSFCDSHTHLVYAGSREQEFLDKIHGLSYEEIARRGGGILNSADRLHDTSEEELYRQAMDDGTDHLAEVLVLRGLAQGYAPVGKDGGQSEAPEDLMVEVVRQQAGEFLLLGEQRLPRRVGHEEGQPQARQQNDHEGEPGKRPRIAERQIRRRCAGRLAGLRPGTAQPFTKTAHAVLPRQALNG